MDDQLIKIIIDTIRSKDRRIRFTIYMFTGLAAGVFITAFLINIKIIPYTIRDALLQSLMVTGVLLGVTANVFTKAIRDKRQKEKVAKIERKVEEQPEKIRASWDLAQEKLENYLDRNLSQVKSIYWLCVIIMFFGFSLISYGSMLVFKDSQNLNAGVVSSISGVLIAFLGGSFLFNRFSPPPSPHDHPVP